MHYICSSGRPHDHLARAGSVKRWTLPKRPWREERKLNWSWRYKELAPVRLHLLDNELRDPFSFFFYGLRLNVCSLSSPPVFPFQPLFVGTVEREGERKRGDPRAKRRTLKKAVRKNVGAAIIAITEETRKEATLQRGTTTKQNRSFYEKRALFSLEVLGKHRGNNTGGQGRLLHARFVSYETD